MKSLIDYLNLFNRKERFHLLKEAVGPETFQLSGSFREKLAHVFSLEYVIPAGCFWAMDYHLDWLYASLYLSKHGEKFPVKDPDNLITANQEDVDLLIAFTDVKVPDLTRIIMLEAKLDTGWTNKQVKSKADRLRKIFGENCNKCHDVIPHFALLSPDESDGLKPDGIPDWMLHDNKLAWIELKPHQEICKITRCDSEGRKNEDGGHWQVEKR